MGENLPEIDNLSVRFVLPQGVARAVDRLSLTLTKGETLGLVCESGCGKSVTSMSIMGLIASPPGRIESGRILFQGKNLLELHSENLRRIRGKEISMIFQEPMTSLNPVISIGRQVAEPLMIHKGLSKSEAFDEATGWLEHVKIPADGKRLKDYPYQLSGGMLQRVMIAMAMVCRPKLLIADEPTTALDVTIQAQILALMSGLKEELGMSLLLITHDFGVIAQMATQVLVMYAGQIVEEASVTRIFDHPFHPYTQGLLKSIPHTGGLAKGRIKRISEIAGTVPSLTEVIVRCKFDERCRYTFDL